MKIAASLVTLGMFLCLPATSVAQTQDPPKEVKVVPPTETPPVPAPATQGDKEKDKGKPKEKAKDDCGTCPDAQLVPAGTAPKKVDLTKA